MRRLAAEVGNGGITAVAVSVSISTIASTSLGARASTKPRRSRSSARRPSAVVGVKLEMDDAPRHDQLWYSSWRRIQD
jgi:hypothetical protein